MDTSELIRILAADQRRPAASLDAMWWAAASVAVALAAAVFFATLGPRPDFAAAVETPRFLFKFAVTVALAAGAFAAVRELSRPGAAWQTLLPVIAAAPALALAAAGLELLLLPPDAWAANLVGTNGIACLTFIPLIGAAPLAVFLLALRQGAPTRPALAGAVAGLLAGGVAASFYAAHCTDDSPLFVATWYTLAIAGLGSIGAAAGRHFVRW
jgi:hypothetical protein